MKKTVLIAGLFSVLSLLSSPISAQQVDDNIALQMYSLRNVVPTDAQFSMAHQAGFKQIELVGNHGLNADQMNALLAKNQLKVISAHVQLADLEQHYADTVAFNKAIGNKVLIVPWVPAEIRPTTEQAWIDFAKRLNDLGQKLRQDQMQLAYHNHDFEMKKYQGKTALELLLDHSDKQNLQLEMDAAWVSRGGQDPVYFLKNYPQRIYALHAKDNASIGVRDDEMNFAPLGEGLLDWQSILPAAEHSGVKWYIIEHDKPKDAWSIITTAHKNLSNALQNHNQ